MSDYVALSGQAKDTSLGPWLGSFGKLDSPQAEPLMETKAPDAPQQDERASANEALDADFLPEDLAMDFESFLNDTDFLGEPALDAEQGSMPVANLFSELFTT